MGVGQGIMEELVMENGRVTNNNLGDYKMPTAKDIPKLTTVRLKSTGGVGPLEREAHWRICQQWTTGPIANAVANAVGVRLFELPVTAEKIYRALKG